MTYKICTNKQRKYDLALHQLACMAEVAHQVHPRILLLFCPSSREAIAILTNIRAIREWFDALEQHATSTAGHA